MYIIIILFSIFAFLKTIGYAIFEYRNNNNKSAGIAITILAFVALIAPCICAIQ